MDRFSVSGTTAVCAVLCAAVMSFIADLGVTGGMLVCWLFCAFLVWVGETAGNALSAGKTCGRNIGAGTVCAILIIPVIVQLCHDLNTPKPPEDQIFNFWGMGSFILLLIMGPPVLAAIILNAAAVISKKQCAARDTAPSRSAKAFKYMFRLILGLTGYAAFLLLLQFY